MWDGRALSRRALALVLTLSLHGGGALAQDSPKTLACAFDAGL